ncbi:MAG: hypothetical protein KIS94_06195 [Chitinophagales bacterium]|nr:hypothetical protein [Chitinophagales bacterium]
MTKLQSPSLMFERQKIYKTNFGANNLVDGKNIKILLVYADYKEDLTASQTDMLSKLVTACGFTEKEKLLINAAKEKISLAQIQANFAAALVVVFDNVKLSNNMILPAKNFPVQVGTQYLLYTVSIAKLETDKAEKARLWSALQGVLKQLK